MLDCAGDVSDTLSTGLVGGVLAGGKVTDLTASAAVSGRTGEESLAGVSCIEPVIESTLSRERPRKPAVGPNNFCG